MSNEPKMRGVFNFNESFPGDHMIRVRLRKHQAWNLLQQLSVLLRNVADHERIDMTWFGELTRDGEEDAGLPIETDGGGD